MVLPPDAATTHSTQPTPAELIDAPSPGYATFQQTRRFGSLDGLRALCILAVMFHHVAPHPDWPKFFHLGFLGVDGFFVLSGILIETLRLREKSRTGSFSLLKFYMRRTLRIFPIYYLLIAAVVGGLWLTKPNSPQMRTLLHELPFYLTYTCNWMRITGVNMSILWSLATEEQFYLIWPFVAKVFRPSVSLALLLAAIVINQMVNFGLFNPWVARVYDAGSVPNIIAITFTPILLGVWLARWLDSPRTFGVLARIIGWRAAPLVLAGLFVLVGSLAPLDLQGWPRLLIQCLFGLLIASLMIREDQFAAPILQWWPLRRLGIVSYGAYLYHMWALHLVSKAFERFGIVNMASRFVALVVVTYIMAEVSFQIIELPFLRLKERRWSAVFQPVSRLWGKWRSPEVAP